MIRYDLVHVHAYALFVVAAMLQTAFLHAACLILAYLCEYGIYLYFLTVGLNFVLLNVSSTGAETLLSI
jgi:hypothetical protein